METAQTQLTSFQREYLWELSVPETQLVSLADVIPEQAYGWRPAEDARRFSAILVHIAAGNLMLLYWANVRAPEVMALCGPPANEQFTQAMEMVSRARQMETTMTQKSAVAGMLKRTFELVEESFLERSEDDLAAAREWFGQPSSLRRIYLRMLTHSHEHMGQVVAYARAMGFHVPWPDPVTKMEQMAAVVG